MTDPHSTITTILILSLQLFQFVAASDILRHINRIETTLEEFEAEDGEAEG